MLGILFDACAADPMYNKSSAVAEMGDHAHNRHGPKRGGAGCAPFAEGKLGPRLTHCGLGWGLLPYQVASSSIQSFGHNRHGPKIGWLRAVPFFLGGAGSPSNTKSPGPRPTSIPSGLLIHSAIWQQQVWAENWGAVPFWGGGAGCSSNTM